MLLQCSHKNSKNDFCYPSLHLLTTECNLSRQSVSKALEELLERTTPLTDNAEELTAKYGDRVFFTPKKMGAQTAEANIKAGIAAAEQVVAHLRDGWNRFQVNK